MAKALALPPPSDRATPKEGSLRWLLTLGLLTLLSAAIGGGFGLVMVSRNSRSRSKRSTRPCRRSLKSSVPIPGDIAIKKLAPVVTNLDGLGRAMGQDGGLDRLQGERGAESRRDRRRDRGRTFSPISARCRSPRSRGRADLLHLREDLNERVKLRSKGTIQELVLETLIVQ